MIAFITRILMFFDLRKTDGYIFKALYSDRWYFVYVKSRNCRVWRACTEVRSVKSGRSYKYHLYCVSYDNVKDLLSLWSSNPKEYEKFLSKQEEKFPSKKVLTFKEDVNAAKMHEALE